MSMNEDDSLRVGPEERSRIRGTTEPVVNALHCQTGLGTGYVAV